MLLWLGGLWCQGLIGLGATLPSCSFSLLVGLIFGWLSLLNSPTAWVDSGAGMRSSKVQVWPFCHQCGLSPQEFEGCAPQLLQCPQTTPNAVGGAQGRPLPWDGMQIFLCSFEHREKEFKNHLLQNGATRKTHLIYMQAWGFPVVFRPEVFTVLPSSYAPKLQMRSVQPMH